MIFLENLLALDNASFYDTYDCFSSTDFQATKVVPMYDKFIFLGYSHVNVAVYTT